MMLGDHDVNIEDLSKSIPCILRFSLTNQSSHQVLFIILISLSQIGVLGNQCPDRRN